MALTRTTPLKRVSVRRRKEMARYNELRIAVLAARPLCEGWLTLAGMPANEQHYWQARAVNEGYAKIARMIYPKKVCPRSEQIHHASGRIGANYLDTATWKAISAQVHRYLHTHPSIAREHGLLV